MVSDVTECDWLFLCCGTTHFCKFWMVWGGGGMFNFPYWLALECWIQDFIVLGRIISLANASGFQEGVFPIPLFS
jgi:hypothetical protein